MKKTIIVTGATGFLGKRTALHLASEGYRVYALGGKTDLTKFFDSYNISFKKGCLASSDLLSTITEPIHGFVHCAALSSPWGKKKDFYLSNVMTTQKCIDFALEKKVKRFVHISTPSIYFDFSNRENITEQCYVPDKQVNHYSSSKLKAERDVLNAYSKYGLPAVVLRPKGIIGAGDTAILPRLLRSFKKNKMVLIKKGSSIVDVTHVNNVVSAIQLSLEGGQHIEGEAFNITNGEPHTVRQLLSSVLDKINKTYSFKHVPYSLGYIKAFLDEQCAKLHGKEPPLTRYSLGVISFSQTFDIQKAKTLLEYDPQYTVEDAISEYMDENS